MKMTNVFEKGAKFVEQNASTILTGVGIVGVVATAAMATNDTIKAVKLLEGNETKKEVVKKTWKCYIPTAICVTASVVSIFGANKISMDKIMTLTTLYSLNEKRFKEYKDKVVKVVGDKKAEAIKDEVAKDDILKNPLMSQKAPIDIHDDDTICYDQLTGRYFKSSVEEVKRIISDFNESLISDGGMVTMNDIYIAWGLDGVVWGDTAGWELSETGTIQPTYSAQLTDVEGSDRAVFCILLDPFILE